MTPHLSEFGHPCEHQLHVPCIGGTTCPLNGYPREWCCSFIKGRINFKRDKPCQGSKCRWHYAHPTLPEFDLVTNVLSEARCLANRLDSSADLNFFALGVPGMETGIVIQTLYCITKFMRNLALGSPFAQQYGRYLVHVSMIVSDVNVVISIGPWLLQETYGCDVVLGMCEYILAQSSISKIQASPGNVPVGHSSPFAQGLISPHLTPQSTPSIEKPIGPSDMHPLHPQFHASDPNTPQGPSSSGELTNSSLSWDAVLQTVRHEILRLLHTFVSDGTHLVNRPQDSALQTMFIRLVAVDLHGQRRVEALLSAATTFRGFRPLELLQHMTAYTYNKVWLPIFQATSPQNFNSSVNGGAGGNTTSSSELLNNVDILAGGGMSGADLLMMEPVSALPTPLTSAYLHSVTRHDKKTNSPTLVSAPSTFSSTNSIKQNGKCVAVGAAAVTRTLSPQIFIGNSHHPRHSMNSDASALLRSAPLMPTNPSLLSPNPSLGATQGESGHDGIGPQPWHAGSHPQRHSLENVHSTSSFSLISSELQQGPSPHIRPHGMTNNSTSGGNVANRTTTTTVSAPPSMARGGRRFGPEGAHIPPLPAAPCSSSSSPVVDTSLNLGADYFMLPPTMLHHHAASTTNASTMTHHNGTTTNMLQGTAMNTTSTAAPRYNTTTSTSSTTPKAQFQFASTSSAVTTPLFTYQPPNTSGNMAPQPPHFQLPPSDGTTTGHRSVAALGGLASPITTPSEVIFEDAEGIGSAMAALVDDICGGDAPTFSIHHEDGNREDIAASNAAPRTCTSEQNFELLFHNLHRATSLNSVAEIGFAERATLASGEAPPQGVVVSSLLEQDAAFHLAQGSIQSERNQFLKEAEDPVLILPAAYSPTILCRVEAAI